MDLQSFAFFTYLLNHFYLFIIKTLFIHSLWHFPISSLANFTLPGQITSSLVMILFSFEADKTFFHQYIMCHIIQFYICFIPLRSTCHLPLPPAYNLRVKILETIITTANRERMFPEKSEKETGIPEQGRSCVSACFFGLSCFSPPRFMRTGKAGMILSL